MRQVLRRQRELVVAHCQREGSQAGAQDRHHRHRGNDAGLVTRRGGPYGERRQRDDRVDGGEQVAVAGLVAS